MILLKFILGFLFAYFVVRLIEPKMKSKMDWLIAISLLLIFGFIVDKLWVI